MCKTPGIVYKELPNANVYILYNSTEHLSWGGVGVPCKQPYKKCYIRTNKKANMN